MYIHSLVYLAAAVLISQVGLGTTANAEDAKSCLECHEQETNSFKSEHHPRAWSAKSETADKSCKTCHGDSEEHVKTEGNKPGLLLSFVKDTKTKTKELNAKCISCHKQSSHMTFWDGGKHARNNVACSSCHNMHKKPGHMVVKKPDSQTCLNCHKETKALLSKRSHHPIKEGKVSCNDCHNPHGSAAPNNLKADSVNQLCFTCHADKRGPFMWEHAPVEENCSTCHNPHGSRHVRMLKEKVPNLCQNCHSWSRHPGTPYDEEDGFATSPSSRFIGRSCNNCHTKIHGSNAPADPSNGYHSGKALTR